MGLALLTVLTLDLVGALLAGLLVVYLVNMLAGVVRIPYLHNRYIKLVLVGVLASIVVTALTFAGIGISVFLRGGPDNLATLFTQLATIMDDLRGILPEAVVSYFPADADGVRATMAAWFRDNAEQIRLIGTDTLRIVVHVLAGLIIGGMIALRQATSLTRTKPLALALAQRADRLTTAFRRIMLAQVPISAINTVLSGIYLAVVLPLYGIDLPFVKTLIAITFIAGLLPVVGNLISNTAIFLVSMTHSFTLAAVSLGYLVIIHKLEYLLNARIVGSHINARAWELLIAMLVLEAIFGLSGLIMAPLAYAYVKYELSEQGLV